MKKDGIQYTDEHVVKLTSENFDTEVLKSQDVWYVEYYKPECPNCERLEPEWNEAATKSIGKAKYGKVECMENPDICERFNVKKHPTILVFKDKEKTDLSGRPYSGKRVADAFIRNSLGTTKEKTLIHLQN